MYHLHLPIVRDLAYARAQMLTTDKELTGHVNVGIIASVAQGVLSDVLGEFVALHPKVTITVADGYSAILADWVAGDMLDAAIINKPRRPIGLNLEPLIDEDLLLVTGNRFHTSLPEQVPMQMVQKLDFVLPTRHHGLRSIIDSQADIEDISITPRVETDSIISILKLVQTTQFVTILPRLSVVHRAEREHLKTHSISAPRLLRQVVCVTHPRRPLNSVSAVFISVLKKHLQNQAT